MLTIPTYVSKSKIHGMGVFTSVYVSKGTKIWEFDSSVDQIFGDGEFEDLLNSLSKDNADKIKSWTYYENGVWILCGDNAKFFNHEEINPSTHDKSGVMFTWASRDLNPGDELTSNYKDFDDGDKLIVGALYETKV